jgi:type IV secretion system protein VirD4
VARFSARTELGVAPSTVTFDPLIVCADPVTAAERASDMLAATGHGYRSAGGDREFWDDQRRRNLVALLRAAEAYPRTME